MRKVIRTGDGSASLYDEEIGESYHSSHGALTESMHVFIHAGLDQLLDQEDVGILEIGLGTGLNAALSWQWAQMHGKSLEYFTVEGFPMDLEFLPDLDFGLDSPDKAKWEDIMRADWDEWVELSSDFKLFKHEKKFEDMNLPEQSFDVVFYDAFSPAHQPEVWSDQILGEVVQAMKPGGVFTTYCCRGHVKRSLKSLGLEIEKLAGPPGKREMLRGRKPR